MAVKLSFPRLTANAEVLQVWRVSLLAWYVTEPTQSRHLFKMLIFPPVPVPEVWIGELYIILFTVPETNYARRYAKDQSRWLQCILDLQPLGLPQRCTWQA